MLQEVLDKKEFTRIQTLCDRCRKATASGCLFLHLEDVGEGLKAVGASASYHETKYQRTFKVVKCREFEPGSLPALMDYAEARGTR